MPQQEQEHDFDEEDDAIDVSFPTAWEFSMEAKQEQADTGATDLTHQTIFQAASVKDEGMGDGSTRKRKPRESLKQTINQSVSQSVSLLHSHIDIDIKSDI